jgi:methylamine dehydrogenase accessory protein MauD
MWVLLVVLGILVVLLYRHFGLISMSSAEGHDRDGLAVGEKAPIISGVTAQGDEVSWSPTPGRSHLLMFASPDCEPCKRVLPYLSELAAARTGVEVAVVVSGPREITERLVEKFKPRFLSLADNARSAHNSYRVQVVPFGFIIDEEGSIRAKGLCSDAGRLQDLLVKGGLGAAATNLDDAAASFRGQSLGTTHAVSVTASPASTFAVKGRDGSTTRDQ